MVDDSDPEAESDLRRRAAWLLVMLAIVAVLLVVVISAAVSTHNSGGGADSGRKPLDPVATETGQSSPPASHSRHHHRQHPPSSSTSSSTSGSTSPAVPVGHTSCPTTQTCVLQGDVGNGIQAINDYRTQQGLPVVPGSVSTKAQNCAVNNGTGCSGGWAETELANPDGREAVQKILPLAHLDDPQMTSVEVGWAFDPGAQLYYFAIVRND